MRTLVRNLITADEDIKALIPENRWKAGGSVSEENLPERPFAVIHFGLTLPGMADIKRGSTVIWIHDDPGTYTGIEAILDRLYGILNGVEQVSDDAGNELMSCEWFATSGDLYDPGFRTITKNISFNLIGKGV